MERMKRVCSSSIKRDWSKGSAPRTKYKLHTVLNVNI